MEEGLFEGCLVVLELGSLASKEKQSLRALVEANGGVLTFALSKATVGREGSKGCQLMTRCKELRGHYHRAVDQTNHQTPERTNLRRPSGGHLFCCRMPR